MILPMRRKNNRIKFRGFINLWEDLKSDREVSSSSFLKAILRLGMRKCFLHSCRTWFKIRREVDLREMGTFCTRAHFIGHTNPFNAMKFDAIPWGKLFTFDDLPLRRLKVVGAYIRLRSQFRYLHKELTVRSRCNIRLLALCGKIISLYRKRHWNKTYCKWIMLCLFKFGE